MTLVEISDWLSESAPSQAIQVTSWAIPAIQTVHLLALAVLFASALMVALRVFGTGLRSDSLSAVAGRFIPPMWICLAILLASGGLLILAEPGRTITNPVFYLKMSMLAVAIIVTLWLRVFARGTRPVGALQVGLACLSMALWACIIVAGRYIAYVEAY